MSLDQTGPWTKLSGSLACAGLTLPEYSVSGTDLLLPLALFTLPSQDPWLPVQQHELQSVTWLFYYIVSHVWPAQM